MSKYKAGDHVRVTNPVLADFDRVGVVVGYAEMDRESASAVQLFGIDYPVTFKQSSLTLADPDVHTVLDQMDAESAPTSKGMDEREIDGEVSRHGSAVEHPAHYGGDTTYEVIKVAEAWGLDKDAYLFNVLKYVARAGKKGAALEDLDKGAFYLDRRRAAMRAAQ